MRLLAIEVDNVQILGRKIHANLPRYERNTTGFQGRNFGRVIHGKLGNEMLGRKWIVKDGDILVERQGNRSFVDVVNNKKASSSSSFKNFMVYNSPKEAWNRFQNAFVGKVSIMGSTSSVQTKLEMEGNYNIKVTPMGGSVCLLEETISGSIGQIIKEGKLWWTNCFDKVKRWEKDDSVGGRVIWLRVFGVPIIAWNNAFFVLLANILGKFICIDDRTANGDWFDVARMLIEVPIDFCLQDGVSVEIDGSSYHLVLRENCGCVCSRSGNLNSLSSEYDSEDSDSVSSAHLCIFDDEIEEFSNSKETVGFGVGDYASVLNSNDSRGREERIGEMSSISRQIKGTILQPLVARSIEYILSVSNVGGALLGEGSSVSVNSSYMAESNYVGGFTLP